MEIIISLMLNDGKINKNKKKYFRKMIFWVLQLENLATSAMVGLLLLPG
jgi:hypothetical protein